MNRFGPSAAIFLLLVVLSSAGSAEATIKPAPDEAAGSAEFLASAPTGDGPWIVRAYDWTEKTVQVLGTYFEHLGVYREKGMLVLHLDTREELEMLLAMGLRVEVDREQTMVLRRLERALESGQESMRAEVLPYVDSGTAWGQYRD